MASGYSVSVESSGFKTLPGQKFESESLFQLKGTDSEALPAQLKR